MTTKPAPGPTFLLVGNHLIALSIIKEAWRLSPTEVVLAVTGRREIRAYGRDAARVWAVLEAHRARCLR